MKSIPDSDPSNLGLCHYGFNDLTIDYALPDAHVFTGREGANRWVAGHYGCLDSPLTETKLNQEHQCVCAVCGGHHVEMAMWVDMRNDKPVDDFFSWGNYDGTWCHDCEEHNGLMYRWHYG